MRMRRQLGRALAALVPAIALAGATAARAADGPGLGNVSYSSNELFKEIGRFVSPEAHGNVAIVNGYLMVIYSSDGGGDASDGGIEFWDVSNPRDPELHVRHDTAQTHALREAHGFGFAKVGGVDVLAAQGEDGIVFFDVTNPDAIARLSYLQLPGIDAGDYTGDWWLAYQAPYVYVAGVDEGLFVVDASDPANPVLVNQIPSSAIGGINPAVVWAIGNLLVVTRNADGGYATLDIGDPENPTLLATRQPGYRGYSHLFAAGKILTSGGDFGPNTIGVHDVAANGLSITPVGQGPTSCGGNQSLGNGGYGSYQDGRFVSGFSTRMAVFNVATRTIVGCGHANISENDEDFGVFLGNVFWAGNDHGNGSTLMPHQTAPDTTGPSVAWVHPANGATGRPLTTRVGLSMSSEVDLDSVDAASFVVRPVGGSALPGQFSVQRGIVNWSPDAPLLPNTTYEVVVDGIEDVVHNAGPSFTSSFTTGNFTPPTCSVATLAPSLVGANAAFDAASVTGPTPITYVWDFGDGSPPTAPSSSAAALHAYADPGRFAAVLTASNAYGSSSCSGMQIVHHPPTATPPAASSAIAHDGTRAFVANPDNDTVTAIGESSLAVAWEAPVGDDPRAVAVAPDGAIWVANRGDATLSILDPSDGGLETTIALPPGSEPSGLVFAPDDSAAYVTLAATGRLLRLDPGGAITGSLDVGPAPRGVSVSGDSERIFVSRYVSPPARLPDPENLASLVLPEGEVREVSAATFAVVRTFALHFDAGPDTEASGRGVPNFLGPARISPDGLRAVVPSQKANVARGVFLEGQPLSFESRTRTILSELDLVANEENAAARIDFNDRDMAQTALFSPLGDLVFVAFEGSNRVEVRDANHPSTRLAALTTGRTPTALALDVDGLGRTLLYVQSFLSRSVSVFDVSSLVGGTGNGAPLLAEIPTVAVEALPPTLLTGKRIFHDATDARINRDGYLSCAGCHADGGSDGQVWDFTQSGEGLRNTIDLVGRAGIGHGNVHWTANFDEIQDFEGEIRNAFAGAGFLSQLDWLATLDPLGAPKAGLDPDLDALAAYVGSFARFPRSPYRNADGSLTPAGVAGKEVFANAGCPACHAAPDFRDGLRHDVGTIRPSSGQGSGAPLAGVGFDTPTLKGLWRSAPYLHDGAAATLAEVLDQPAHVGALSPAEQSDLAAYLAQIDDLENPACSNFVDDDGDTLVDLADPQCSDPSDDSEEPSPACSNGADDDGDGLADFPNDPGCADADDDSERAAELACDDGVDNDDDTNVDFPADAGCASPSDPSETAACGNGLDDDGDGLTDFPADPGCADADDDSERAAELACDDGADNDGDLSIDFPADAGCTSPSDPTETAACSNGADDDGDGLADFPNDPGCADADDDSERAAELACDDGLDNDGDLSIDFPADAGCASPNDPAETAACSDGLDDDGDGLADFPADPGCAFADDDSERAAELVCDDGLDNDGDTQADFPADAGCTSPSDATETAACSNDLDDDGDGLADFPADPGCTDADDDSERASALACDDGLDNDGDLAIDFPADAGCASPSDASETAACSNGLDDDGDGLADFPSDPGCADAGDDSERAAELVCDDGADNDGDTHVDFPADPACTSPTDPTEVAACSDGVDRDGDTLLDYPLDPGCSSAEDDSERDPALACDDGVDNDGDGGIDYPGDIGCQFPYAPRENPACQNGLDDDGDGKIDFDGGASLHGGTPIAPADPHCTLASRDKEKAPGACGLGFEVAFLLPAFGALRRRRQAGGGHLR